MRMTERVKEIIELNLTDHYFPLVVEAQEPCVIPVYYARIMEESKIGIPVTNATGIDKVLEEDRPASALVADRDGGYEAYLLQGKAHAVTDAEDYEFVASMRNEAPGFPIHGAVVFQVENVELVPPP